MQIVTLLPGINAPGGTHVQRNSTALGLPQSAIAIVIDGVNIQDQSVKSTDGFYPDIRPQNDLVEQVTITEATGTADSSGQGSVQIKFVTRSGSNRTIGSGYEYLRDSVLNTNSWANSSKGLPKNAINWNQFGFRQGGPIVIPGLYDGHNKAFYFVNYEEFRLPITSSTTRAYVSPAAQGGLFQYGCTASGCSSAVNILQLAARNGQGSTLDPTIAAMFSQINAAVATQGAIQTNADLNTLRYTAAESVPRRAPAGRPCRRQPQRQAPSHGHAGIPEGQFRSGHHQQRLSELPGICRGQHPVFVPLHGNDLHALDAHEEHGERGGLGHDLVAGLFLREHYARPIHRRLQPHVSPGTKRHQSVAVQRDRGGAKPQWLELQLPRHAELAQGQPQLVDGRRLHEGDGPGAIAQHHPGTVARLRYRERPGGRAVLNDQLPGSQRHGPDQRAQPLRAADRPREPGDRQLGPAA